MALSALARPAERWHHGGTPLALGILIHGRTRAKHWLLGFASGGRRDVAGELWEWREQFPDGDSSGDHDATFQPNGSGRSARDVLGGRNQDSALELSVAEGH